MNNDLEQFSEEYLKEIINSPADDLTIALARIALAAKQAKPVAYTDNLSLETLQGNGMACMWKEGNGSEWREQIPLYTTPQPDHTEQVIPDGWLAIPATPSQAHLNSIAMRYRHDFYLLNEAQKQSALATARQMYEECSGQGYFNIAAPKPESE